MLARESQPARGHKLGAATQHDYRLGYGTPDGAKTPSWPALPDRGPRRLRWHPGCIVFGMGFLSEQFLREAVFFLVGLVEAGAAIVIFVGAAVGFVRFMGAVVTKRPALFTPVRLDVGRFLALGLSSSSLAVPILR